MLLVLRLSKRSRMDQVWEWPDIVSTTLPPRPMSNLLRPDGLVPKHLWKIPTGDSNIDTESCTPVVVPSLDPTLGAAPALAPSYASASPNIGCCYLQDPRCPPADHTTSSCYASFASDKGTGGHLPTFFCKTRDCSACDTFLSQSQDGLVNLGSSLPPDDDPRRTVNLKSGWCRCCLPAPSLPDDDTAAATGLNRPVDDATIGKYSVSLPSETEAFDNSISHDLEFFSADSTACYPEERSPPSADDTRRGCYRVARESCAPADDATIEMYYNSGSDDPDPTACYTARRVFPSHDDKTSRDCCQPARSSPDIDTVGCYRVYHDEAEGCDRVSHEDRSSCALPVDDAAYHSNSSCLLPADDTTVGTGVACLLYTSPSPRD